MNNPPDGVSLPSAPSLIGSLEFSQIQSLLSELNQRAGTDKQRIDETWGQVLKEYDAWEKSFSGAHTSTTNRKLYFYQLFCRIFPSLPLKNDSALLGIVLSDLNKPGECIRMRLPDGTIGNATVVRREITERFGVLFTMKSEKGALFSHEFFD
jgi:hypothetical protein